MLSVIIPVLKNVEYTENLFKDISNNVVLPDELLLIDNSEDDSYDNLVEEYKEKINIIHMKQEKNLGVNGSWNFGIEKSKNNLVSILNNDLLVNKFFFKKIIETMENEKVGICVPETIKDMNDYLFYNHVDEPVTLRGIRKRQGWAFTINKIVVDKCGYIPCDKIKTFYGDDFLFNCTRSLGLRTPKITNNIIFHYENATLKKYFGDFKQELIREKNNWEEGDLK
jgi:GT2 family glycosyltransferase